MSFTLFDVGGQSKSQFLLILGLRATSCILSLLGSTFVAMICWRKRDRFYHRLMMILSLSDIVSSFAYLLSPFLMQSESGYPHAVGSDKACSAVGFVYQTFYSMTSVLSASLSLSFVLAVKYNMKDEQVAAYTEKGTYFLAIALSPIIPAIALSDEAFSANPFVHFCSFMDSPPGCNNLGTTCIKGDWATELLTASNYLRGSMTVFAIGSVAVTYWTVRQISKKQLAYSFSTSINLKKNGGADQVGGLANAGEADVTGDHDENGAEQAQEDSERADQHVSIQNSGDNSTMKAHQAKMKRLFARSCMYLLAYFNSVVWNGIGRWLANDADWFGNLGEPGWMIFQVFYALFTPFQGALNFCIFVRPLYMEWRPANMDKSWIVVLYHLIWDGGERSLRKNSRFTASSTRNASSGQGRNQASSSNP